MATRITRASSMLAPPLAEAKAGHKEKAYRMSNGGVDYARLLNVGAPPQCCVLRFISGLNLLVAPAARRVRRRERNVVVDRALSKPSRAVRKRSSTKLLVLRSRSRHNIEGGRAGRSSFLAAATTLKRGAWRSSFLERARARAFASASTSTGRRRHPRRAR